MTRDLRSYRAEGIVLRRRNIGEADSIFVVFGEHEGKFEGVARGIRKARSKMRGHLEPVNYCRFLLARGRSLDVFTQAETIRSFPRVSGDLDRWASASYYLEIVDRLTVEHAENRALFHLLYAALDALDEGTSLAPVSRYVELHALSVSGFELQVEACAVCHERLEPEPALFSSATGGLVCRSCRPAAGAGQLVSVDTIKVLRHARRSSLPDFAALRIPDTVRAELQSCLGDAIRYYVDRELGTARFVQELNLRQSGATRTPETL